MQRFQKEFEVHYYEVNLHQELTPLALLNYLEETAIAHSESVGYGVSRLKEMGYGWVLTHWQLEVKQYPRFGEKIRIQTWPSRFVRFHADREFLIRNSQDEVIAKASSLWIFLNLLKRRPLRIPKEVVESYAFHPEKAISTPFPEFVLSPTLKSEQRQFLIRRSDIDTNAHVNNAKYIEWMFETIPEEVYATYQLSSLEVSYKKESIYGQIIQAVTEEQERTEQAAQFLHQIIEKEEGQELALARTQWHRREKKLASVQMTNTPEN